MDNKPLKTSIKRGTKPHSDPFIDRFIEEIADLVGGQGGVDTAVLSSMESAARNPTSSDVSSSNPSLAAMARSLKPSNPLAAADQSSEDRKTQGNERQGAKRRAEKARLWDIDVRLRNFRTQCC